MTTRWLFGIACSFVISAVPNTGAQACHNELSATATALERRNCIREHFADVLQCDRIDNEDCDDNTPPGLELVPPSDCAAIAGIGCGQPDWPDPQPDGIEEIPGEEIPVPK